MKKILKRLLKIIGIVLIVCILVTGTIYLMAPKQAKPKDTISTVDDLDNYFQEITEKQFPPSISIVVYKQGEKAYEKAFGYADYPEEIMAETSTIYPWFSTTKLFTAVAVMQLVEKGKIDLEDTVEKHLPYFLVYSEEGIKKDITIRQLLMHRAGLKSMMPDLLKWVHQEGEEGPSVTEFFKDKIVPDYNELAYEPGSESDYTNTAYIILGAIIEEVTGVKYEDYVSENILKPLEMDNSSFVRNEELSKRTATGSNPVINLYTALMILWGDKNFFKDYVDSTLGGRHWYKVVYTDYTPSTALSGTADELARFGQLFFNEGIYKGKRILEPESVSLMLADFKLEDLDMKYEENVTISIGFKVWNLNNSVAYGHAGGGPGYGCMLVIIPEKELVFSVNANDTNIDRNLILEVLASVDW